MSKKIIFITGVTSGVGRETARRFIKEGWKVIGTGRRQSRLEELAAELGGDFLPSVSTSPSVTSWWKCSPTFPKGSRTSTCC